MRGFFLVAVAASLITWSGSAHADAEAFDLVSGSVTADSYVFNPAFSGPPPLHATDTDGGVSTLYSTSFGAATAFADFGHLSVAAIASSAPPSTTTTATSHAGFNVEVAFTSPFVAIGDPDFVTLRIVLDYHLAGANDAAADVFYDAHFNDISDSDEFRLGAFSFVDDADSFDLRFPIIDGDINTVSLDIYAEANESAGSEPAASAQFGVTVFVVGRDRNVAFPLVPVPEPTTVALFGLSLAALSLILVSNRTRARRRHRLAVANRS